MIQARHRDSKRSREAAAVPTLIRIGCRLPWIPSPGGRFGAPAWCSCQDVVPLSASPSQNRHRECNLIFATGTLASRRFPAAGSRIAAGIARPLFTVGTIGGKLWTSVGLRAAQPFTMLAEPTSPPTSPIESSIRICLEGVAPYMSGGRGRLSYRHIPASLSPLPLKISAGCHRVPFLAVPF